MAALDPGPEHTDFVAWAEDNGVEINGIAPARFKGRGMGIVAARDIKEGDKLVHVASKSLIHVALPSIKALNLPSTMTVHGKLAASLAMWYTNKTAHPYTPWQAVWPTAADFQLTMPLYFPASLQAHLPPAATTLLTNQKKNLERDWLSTIPLNLAVDKETYTYTWLIVNTRTFYWDYPDLSNASPLLPKRRSKLTANDCYCMCPFIDYFNHSDAGCDPQHDAKGYSVTADRAYAAGEEVFVTYGSHSNDFLLSEYGFILPGKNRHDAIPLDDLLIPLLEKGQMEALKEDGFYGNYTLFAPRGRKEKDKEGGGEEEDEVEVVCHRTQALLRLLILDSKRYATFVSGEDDGARDQSRLNLYLAGVLVRYSRKIADTIEEVEGLELGSGEQGQSEEEKEQEKEVVEAQRDTVLKRWKQIRHIVNSAVQTLEA
ncbi:set domain-containing protein [Stemphylium lycopersici]|nr:set domain-containing protein [Stemphylium lycopersici]RAR07446.1 set domain-containing protein [Stemphylium lycopersici]